MKKLKIEKIPKLPLSLSDVLPFVFLFAMNPNHVMANSSGENSMTKKVEPLETAEVAKLFADFDYKAHSLDAATFLKMAKEKGSVILDLRSSADFKKGHALGAINLDIDVTEAKLSKLIPSKDTLILTYCSNSFAPTRKISLTHTLVPQLFQLGYKRVFFLEAMAGWGSGAKSLKQSLGWTE